MTEPDPISKCIGVIDGEIDVLRKREHALTKIKGDLLSSNVPTVPEWDEVVRNLSLGPSIKQQILDMLSDGKERTSRDFVKAVNAYKPSVMSRLSLMANTGQISRKKIGGVYVYRLPESP